jgi:hypothetical protein
MNAYHLTKSGTIWVLKKENSQTVLVSAFTKERAILQSKEYIQKKNAGGGSLRIHKEDGRIEEERTYAPALDPVGSKG